MCRLGLRLQSPKQPRLFLPPSLYRFQYAFTTSDRQSLVPNVFYYQSQPLFTSLDPVGLSVGGRYLNSKAGAAYQREIHWRSHAGAKGSMLIFCLLLSSRWPEDAQEEMSILQISDQGTGKRVLLQCLHQQREASAAFADAQPDRSPGQDLVPKQKDEGEETEQRPFTVLHHEPPAIKNWTKTADTHLSLLHTHLYHYLDRRTRF